MTTKRQLAPKRPIHSIERIIADIRALRDSNKRDNEIRNLLEIPLRTYQRYTKRIYEEDKQIWYDISSQELAGELLKLRTCLNNSYNIAKKMADDETADIGERLEACQAANDCRLSLVQILHEYPAFMKEKKIPSLLGILSLKLHQSALWAKHTNMIRPIWSNVQDAIILGGNS